MSTAIQPLILAPTGSASLDPITVDSDRSITVGRSPDCDVQLNDSAVSRRHATISRADGDWVIVDLGSRNGTLVDDVPLTANTQTPLRPGDRLTIGPWTFRVGGSVAGPNRTATWTDELAPGSRVEAVSIRDLGSIVRQQLSLLMECAQATHTSADEASLATGVLDAVLSGTGMSRAAIVRGEGSFQEIDIIGLETRGPENPRSRKLSASLLRAASSGTMARLLDQPDLREAVSICELGVTSGICTPIFVGEAIAAYLYVDDLGGAGRAHGDSASFCDAIATLCGLAIANLRRKELEERQAQLERQFEPARNVQNRILPETEGTVGPIRYAMASLPGQLVAGDLLDVVQLDESTTAVYLGDVTGKGLGPAMLMATSQAQLSLLLDGPPEEAITRLNKHVHDRSSAGEFITLWLGIIDGAGIVRHIDAGHGHALVVRASGDIDRVESDGCLPIGVTDECVCATEELTLAPGDRLVLFSDGIVEQADAEDEQFGMERLYSALAASASCPEDVRIVVDAVKTFAETDRLADDVTIVSLELA